jgi:hypothetical protein
VINGLCSSFVSGSAVYEQNNYVVNGVNVTKLVGEQISNDDSLFRDKMSLAVVDSLKSALCVDDQGRPLAD